MNRVVVKIGIGAWIVSTAVIIITLFMLYVQCPEGSTLWIDGRGFGCGGDIGGMVGQMVTDRGMRWIGFISVPCAFILFIGYLLPEPNIRPIFNDRNLCQAGVAGACLGLITNNLL